MYFFFYTFVLNRMRTAIARSRRRRRSALADRGVPCFRQREMSIVAAACVLPVIVSVVSARVSIQPAARAGKRSDVR